MKTRHATTLLFVFLVAAPTLTLAGCDFNTYFDFEPGSGGEAARESQTTKEFLDTCSNADLASFQNKYLMAGIRDASSVIRCDEQVGGWIAPRDENRTFPVGNDACCADDYCDGNCTMDNRTCGGGFACAPGAIIHAACLSTGMTEENCTEAFAPKPGTNNKGKIIVHAAAVFQKKNVLFQN
jgi:hypothetical protein